MDYKKRALDWLEKNDLLYWRIVNSDNEVMAKVEADDLSPDESIAKLSYNLGMLPSGFYKMKARKKKADANGEVVYSFYVEPDYPAPSAPKVTGNDEEVAKLKAKTEALEKALAKHETDKLVRDIEAKWEKKFEKLQESQAPQPNIIEQITGLMGLLTQARLPQAVQPITGAPHQQAQQQPTNDQGTQSANPNANANMIIQTALGQMRRIFQDDNSFLYFLQSVGNIAEHEPNKFMMILQFLPQPPQQQPEQPNQEE